VNIGILLLKSRDSRAISSTYQVKKNPHFQGAVAAKIGILTRYIEVLVFLKEV